METLLELLGKYKVGDWPDKNTTHSYIPVYEEILAPYRHTAINVLEIGLFNGSSLKMWEQYFTMANVYGIDCDEQPHGGMADLKPMIASGQHRIYIMDATNQESVKKHFKEIKFDVIIEDAAHYVSQQVAIYETFKKYLSAGSIYIIEDLQAIDDTRWIFESIDFNKKIEIIDRRHVKQRYDDCLVLIKDKE